MYFFTLDEVIDACFNYIKAEFLPTIIFMCVMIFALVIVSIYILCKLGEKEDKNNGK